jgi:hypothetical protein
MRFAAAWRAVLGELSNWQKGVVDLLNRSVLGKLGAVDLANSGEDRCGGEVYEDGCPDGAGGDLRRAFHGSFVIARC